MRRNRLISVLVILTVGCSASGDGGELLELPDATQAPPSGADELVDPSGPKREGGGYGILLLDTTSSMTTTRSSTGNTRCEDALVMAESYINDFFDPSGVDGDGLAVWTFTNITQTTDDVQPTSTDYYTDAESAIAALDGISCSGSTPLADSMCKSFNGDGETFTLDPLPDQMFILTDGLEDNSDGPCSGTSGSPYTPGSWQYKVLTEMDTAGIKLDTRYWIDPALLYDTVAIDSFAAGEEDPDPMQQELQIVADVENLSPAAIDRLMSDASPSAAGPTPGNVDQACDTVCQELALFEELAIASGGSWGVVADDDADYPSASDVDPAEGPKHPTQEPTAEPGIAPS